MPGAGAPRVLVVANAYPPAANGGYERLLRGCVLAQRAAGHQVEVLTTVPVAGMPVDHEVDEGVHRDLRWYWRDFGWPALSPRERLAVELGNRRVLRRHLRALRPDVVTWWQMGGMSLGLLEHVRRARVPAIGMVADEWMGYSPDHDLWMETWRWHPRLGTAVRLLTGLPVRPRIADAARWVFLSQYLVERAATALGRPVPDAGVLRAGVDPARFPFAEPQPWRGRLLYLGRVEETKGVHVAVAALAHLDPTTTLRVVGPAAGEYEARLRALAAEVGVEGRVELAPYTDAPHEEYAAADCVLFPNLWNEPWGLVPLEAMAVGRPVVSTATGGSAEFLEHERTCLRVAHDDPADLAAAITRLGQDDALRARLVEHGRALAASLTEDAFERGWVEEVEALVRRARPGG